MSDHEQLQAHFDQRYARATYYGVEILRTATGYQVGNRTFATVEQACVHIRMEG